MPLRVRCECGESLTVPENKAGMRVLCPVCNTRVTIPPARSVAPPPPQPKAASRPEPKATEDDSIKRPAVTKSESAKTPAAEPKQPRPQPREKKPRAAPKPPPLPTPPPRKSKPKQESSAKPASPPPLAKNKSEEPARQVASTNAGAPPGKKVAEPSMKAEARETKSTLPAASRPTKPQPAPPPVSVDKRTPTAPPAKSKEPAAPSHASTPPGRATEEPVRGVEHDPGKLWTVYQLAMSMAALTFIGMFPAMAEVYRHWTDFDSTGVEAWAYFLFLLTGIQLVYAFYLVQLPDWSTVWVVMIVSAGVTVFYAGGMGVSLMAATDNALLASLGLAELNRAGYVSPWMLLMTLLTSLLTYFLIRTSVRWHKSFELAMAGRNG